MGGSPSVTVRDVLPVEGAPFHSPVLRAAAGTPHSSPKPGLAVAGRIGGGTGPGVCTVLPQPSRTRPSLLSPPELQIPVGGAGLLTPYILDGARTR